jgi:hypothetical protein
VRAAEQRYLKTFTVRRVSLQTVQAVKEELNLLDCFFDSKKK